MAEHGHSISEEDIVFIKHKLSQLESSTLDAFRKRIKALSYICQLLRKSGIRPILVGGHAVELYTAGHYSTVDIDLVLSGYEDAGEILVRLGFVKESRHWYYKPLNILIEIPDNVLAGSLEKVNQIMVEEGFSIDVIGIEDLILDRVRAYVHWNSPRDREWALIMMGSLWDKIDFRYLKETAKAEEVEYQAVLSLEESLLKNK